MIDGPLAAILAIVERLEEGQERSYSINTIERVNAMGGTVLFVIGADAFAEIRTWHRWREVAAEVRFLVVSRPGHDYDTPPEVRAERLDTVELPVSSSEIRRQLAAGLRPAEVPETVLNYIEEKGLYVGNETAR